MAPSTGCSNGPARRSRLGDATGTLAIAGLAALIVVGGVGAMGLESRVAKRTGYVLMGTAFPALLLAGSQAYRLGRVGRGLALAAGLGLAAVAAGGASWLVARSAGPGLLALGVASAGMLVGVRAVRLDRAGRWPRPRIRLRGQHVRLGLAWPHIPGVLATGLALVASWCVAPKLFYWGDFVPWVAAVPARVVLLLGALTLCTLNLGRRSAHERRPRSRLSWAVDAAALSLILLASTRVDTLGAPSPVSTAYLAEFRFHHWGAAVGPAELVRQGGWLLWDVPAQYGFLSTLTVAALPFRSTWQAYYALHVALTFLTAGMLYALLRSARTGPTNAAFALVTTVTVAFLITGVPHDQTGPSTHPPLTAFRHIWSFVLLAVLIVAYRRPAASRWPWLPLACGNLAWVLGVLWSAESAVYSSATWLPAYAVLCWDRASAACPREAGRGRLGMALGWRLAAPPVALAGAMAAITTFYRARLGHAPDWPRFLDHMLSFNGYDWLMDQPHRPDGMVWVLVFALCGLAALALAAVRRGDPKVLALAAGAWGMLWAGGGYFALRAVEVALLNLGTVLVTCLAVALVLMAREPDLRRVGGPIRAGLIPVLTVLITITFGNGERLPDWGPALRRGYVRSVDRLMAPMDPGLAALLRGAGVRPRDPIQFLDNRGGDWTGNALPLWPAAGARRPGWYQRAWTPALPFTLFAPLTADRRAIYMRRFAERRGLGGWLVESRLTPAPAAYPDFFAALARTHRPVAAFEDGAWRLTRYEPLAPVAARDASGAARR
jgi:hypothetical protein